MSGPALAHPEAPSEVLAERSGRQSLHRIMLPFGYSNSHGPRSVKPSFLQMALEGPFSTGGKAWRNRCFLSDFAQAIALSVADRAIPRP
jgi:hypothetical protein